jgi:iron(III) transport system permease protein
MQTTVPPLPVPRLWIRLGLGPWTWVVLGTVAILAIPLAVIGVGVLEPAGATWTHLSRTVLPDYLLHSAVLLGGVGILALLMGVSTAWLVASCDFPGRRVFEWALILPLAVPAYVAAYTYAGMFDVAGPVQLLIRSIVPSLSNAFIHLDVKRIETVIVIFALVLYPYVYLITRASFARQSRTVLEASRTLGCTATATFFRVALPLARPAIAAGLTLVLLEVLNDYGAVHYYGVTTFTTGIFRAWLSLGDLTSAIRLSAFLLFFVFLLLSLERAQRGRARYDDRVETFRPTTRATLRGGRAVAAVVVCAVPIVFGFLVPVLQLSYWGSRTGPHVLDVEFVRLVLNSFGVASGAALLCVVVALILAYAVRVTRLGWVRVVSRIAVLGYSVPGAVIAVGVLIPFAWMDRSIDSAARAGFSVSTGLLLSGTLVALIFAYVVRFMAVGLTPVESGFTRICGNLDDAARTLGAGPWRTLRSVALPLLSGTLLAALILVFVDTLKELPLTLILRPFNFDTLATTAFQLARDEQIAESAPAALLIVATSIVPIILLSRVVSGPAGRRTP